MMRALKAKSSARVSLRTAFHWSHDRTFSGFAFDAADPIQKLVIELVIDGMPVRSARAAEYIGSIDGVSFGDGCHGFSFSLSDSEMSEASIIEARLANLGTAVGEPITIAASGNVGSKPSNGAVRWLGGLRFAGWIGDGIEPIIDVMVDGEHVNRVRATGWGHVGGADDARAVRSFDVHLPDRFADGSAHRLVVRAAQGQKLDGAPLPFLAFSDGLERLIAASAPAYSNDLRGEMFDRLVPMSIPFADYERWRRLLPDVKVTGPLPKFSVIAIGETEIDDTLTSLNDQNHSNWVAASLPDMAGHATFDNAAAREFLTGEADDAEFVLFMLAGTVLAPSALLRLSAVFADHEDVVAAYGDVDMTGDDGSVWPLVLPAFDYERLLEQGYCSYLFALRRQTALRVLDGGASDLFRVFNSLLDEAPAASDRIIHVPGSLARLPAIEIAEAGKTLGAAVQTHLTRRQIAAEIAVNVGQILPAVHVRRETRDPSVAIVIPTRNRRELLEACIESVRPVLDKPNREIIVVDNDSSDRDTLDYLASIEGRRIKVLRVAGTFNFARLNNVAASTVHADVLCLLNNDIKARSDDWLDEMLGRIAPDDVGAVGAQLVWPSGVVQHGGVVLGPNFAAIHAFNDRIEDDAGYGDQLLVAHECSAVTAACLLTRRRDFIALGGMDEFRFPVNFNDVDYCLKLRAAGKRVVFTPHARLLHRESASRGLDRSPDRKARHERELQNLRAKWGSTLAADPFYSPVLSLDPVPFSALAWPLRSMQPRRSNRPVAADVPPGF
jgi:GT2 family glycosyltransferase